MNLNKELIDAARNGNIIRVKVLLKLGADLRTDNNRALRIASSFGHKNVCKVLLEHGADVVDTLIYAQKYFSMLVYNSIITTLMQAKNELKL